MYKDLVIDYSYYSAIKKIQTCLGIPIDLVRSLHLQYINVSSVLKIV